MNEFHDGAPTEQHVPLLSSSAGTADKQIISCAGHMYAYALLCSRRRGLMHRCCTFSVCVHAAAPPARPPTATAAHGSQSAPERASPAVARLGSIAARNAPPLPSCCCQGSAPTLQLLLLSALLWIGGNELFVRWDLRPD